ncbi:helix-turn-helix domain-containing protein [Modestobacter marinus]|uniref:helix-turn-helix domain-containing protein n=1 Tax=Modestobacter marinus TaxID=477641 RepID=UPI001C956FE4|nr:helix-turn-helix domain-containing protein [Modestobacter marinus]
MSSPPPLRQMTTCDPLLLTPEEAAQVLCVGRTTLYALIRDGDLRPVHIGRSCRLSRAELERYVDRLMTVGPAPSSGPDRHKPTPSQIGGRLGTDAGMRRLQA